MPILGRDFLAKNCLRDFPQVMRVSSSGYSSNMGALSSAQGASPRHTPLAPALVALKEFRAMERLGIISRSTGHPAPHIEEEWPQRVEALRRLSALNIMSITDSYVILNLHSLNFQFFRVSMFSLNLILLKATIRFPSTRLAGLKLQL